MSTGIIATVGLPAQATNQAASPEAATAGAALASPVLLADSPFLSTSPLGATPQLSAPAAATVSFDSSTFSVAPKPEAVVSAADAISERTTASRVGRSQVRTDLATSFGNARGSSVIAVASRYLGTPYVYGGTTPNGFDCSGFTKYVFGQLGYSLPRTANEQMNYGTRISRSEAQPGDLVSFVSGGQAYHIGIYAGDGMIIDSPRAGKTVSKRAIWSSSVVYSRIG